MMISDVATCPTTPFPPEVDVPHWLPYLAADRLASLVAIRAISPNRVVYDLDALASGITSGTAVDALADETDDLKGQICP